MHFDLKELKACPLYSVSTDDFKILTDYNLKFIGDKSVNNLDKFE